MVRNRFLRLREQGGQKPERGSVSYLNGQTNVIKKSEEYAPPCLVHAPTWCILRALFGQDGEDADEVLLLASPCDVLAFQPWVSMDPAADAAMKEEEEHENEGDEDGSHDLVVEDHHSWKSRLQQVETVHHDDDAANEIDGEDEKLVAAATAAHCCCKNGCLLVAWA